MGFIPFSFVLEGFLFILWFWFAILSEPPTYLSRGFGMLFGIYFFALLTLPQIFYTDTTGVCCTVANVGIPTNQYRIMLSVGVIIIYIGIIQFFAIADRDIVGRKKKKIE